MIHCTVLMLHHNTLPKEIKKWEENIAIDKHCKLFQNTAINQPIVEHLNKMCHEEEKFSHFIGDINNQHSGVCVCVRDALIIIATQIRNDVDHSDHNAKTHPPKWSMITIWWCSTEWNETIFFFRIFVFNRKERLKSIFWIDGNILQIIITNEVWSIRIFELWCHVQCSKTTFLQHFLETKWT